MKVRRGLPISSLCNARREDDDTPTLHQQCPAHVHHFSRSRYFQLRTTRIARTPEVSNSFLPVRNYLYRRELSSISAFFMVLTSGLLTAGVIDVSFNKNKLNVPGHHSPFFGRHAKKWAWTSTNKYQPQISPHVAFDVSRNPTTPVP